MRPAHQTCFQWARTLVAFMLGHAPVEGSTPEQLLAAWTAFDPMTLRQRRPDIDPALHDWLVWLLRVDPQLRPASAQQALDVLHSAGTGFLTHPFPAPMVPIYAPPVWPAGMMQPPPQPTQSQPLIDPPVPEAPAPRPFFRPPGAPAKEVKAAAPVVIPKRKRRAPIAIIINLAALGALIGFFVWMSHHWGPQWPQHLRAFVIEKLGGKVEDAPAASGAIIATSPPAGSSNGGIMGQFVRIEIPGTATLNLAEVEIISLGVNIAPNGTASAKDSAWTTDASAVIDGNTSGDWKQKSIYHSMDNTDTPWLEIDLGTEHPIQTVRLWNRTDRRDYSKRLANYSVLVFSKDKSVRWRADEQQTPSGPSATFDLSP